MATTLAQIRIGVLGLVGDVDELEATQTSVDASTFRDDLNLSRESGTLVGRFLILPVGSVNSGLVRRVTSNDKATATIVLSSPLDQPVEQGTRATLINYRDQGVSKQKVDRAINDAIRAVQADYLLPTTIQSQSFSYGTPVIALDPGIVGVAGVDFQVDDGEWWELDLTDWTADRWSRTISLTNRGRFNAETRTVRIRGYSQIGLLVDDDDETIVDYEWLVYQAASNFHFELARRRMDPQNNERWGQYFGDKADERRMKAQLPTYAMVVHFYE